MVVDFHVELKEYLYSQSPSLCLRTIRTGLYLHSIPIFDPVFSPVFYRNLSKLYSKVLLEFPTKDDPMVKLLIRKKNENIIWDWDEVHKLKCMEFFNIESQFKLSETRFIMELSNIKSN